MPSQVSSRFGLAPRDITEQTCMPLGADDSGAAVLSALSNPPQIRHKKQVSRAVFCQDPSKTAETQGRTKSHKRFPFRQTSGLSQRDRYCHNPSWCHFSKASTQFFVRIFALPWLSWILPSRINSLSSSLRCADLPSKGGSAIEPAPPH